MKPLAFLAWFWTAAILYIAVLVLQALGRFYGWWGQPEGSSGD